MIKYTLLLLFIVSHGMSVSLFVLALCWIVIEPLWKTFLHLPSQTSPSLSTTTCLAACFLHVFFVDLFLFSFRLASSFLLILWVFVSFFLHFCCVYSECDVCGFSIINVLKMYTCYPSQTNTLIVDLCNITAKMTRSRIINNDASVSPVFFHIFALQSCFGVHYWS